VEVICFWEANCWRVGLLFVWVLEISDASKPRSQQATVVFGTVHNCTGMQDRDPPCVQYQLPYVVCCTWEDRGRNYRAST
jgi:hypothetical protein